MKSKLVLINLFALLFFVQCDKNDTENTNPAKSVKYRVTFNFNWNKSDFPNDYPSNAHFSKLIGWSHKSTDTLFKEGTMASKGIESMAETGATATLDNELNDRIKSGEGLNFAIGSNFPSGTGESSVDILIDKEYSSVTLAAMLAPSPDWYVAVVNINLLENKELVDNKTVYAEVYDSGTDDGVTFVSSNEDSVPQQPISKIADPPLGNGTTVTPAIATVKFSKQE